MELGDLKTELEDHKPDQNERINQKTNKRGSIFNANNI